MRVLSAMVATFFLMMSVAQACIEIPKYMSLKDSSFGQDAVLSVGMKCKPRFTVTDWEGDSLTFFRDDQGKICVDIGGSSKATHCQGTDGFKALGLDGKNHISLTDKNKEAKAVMSIGNKGELLIFSTTKGQKDLQKPYLSVQIGQNREMKIESFHKGNLTGQFEGKSSVTSCHTRSIGASKPVGSLEMAGFNHKASGDCSVGVRSEPFESGGTSPSRPRGGPGSGRDG